MKFSEDAVMVAFAISRLQDGRRPAEAYLDLVATGANRRPAAIAVCVAGGTEMDVAEQRLRAYDGSWSLRDEDVAELLESNGYFDLEVALTDAQNAAVSLIQQAMAQVALRPAYATELGRLLRTGRLTEAIDSLRTTGRERWPENPRFWGLLEQASVHPGVIQEP